METESPHSSDIERKKSDQETLIDALFERLADLERRAMKAEATIELVRTQGMFWAACAAETVAAFGRGVLALLDDEHE